MARWVRLTSLSCPSTGGGDNRRERAIEHACRYIDEAAACRPDLICLPETFTALGCGSREWSDSAEPIPGPTIDVIAARARQHGCYIVCPLVEQRGGRRYNSAVLIDRRGEVAGVYRKIHPTVSEIEVGITPGTEAPIFETDFGRVGIAICFDLNFPDVLGALAAPENGHPGAELICFPSMYRGGLQLRVWAFSRRLFLLSATPGENSALVSPAGRILVESSFYQRVISARVNLDAAVVHLDYNHAQFAAVQARYGPDIEIEVHSPEAVALVTCHHPERRITDVLAEFGLETFEAYMERSNRRRGEALAAPGA